MKVPFVDLRTHHFSLREELMRAFEEVMESGEYSCGSFVEAFETDFAEYCGTRHAVGVGSGTDALWLTLKAMGIGPGDEVITVPMTFFATAEAISMTGATPVFVDVDERTFTMNPSAMENAITPKTRAIIPVHLFGQPAEMDTIVRIAGNHGIRVIEDASQAHGAEYKGRKAGSLADAGCFSFYPAKNLGAMGEAGAVVTDDDRLAHGLRALRNHGQSSKNVHAAVGSNSRMDALQAAILRIKLRRLDHWNLARRKHAARYHEAFNAFSEIRLPVEMRETTQIYHIYAIQVPDRAGLIKILENEGIGFGLHYPLPIHLQKAYAGLGHGKGDFPVSEQCAENLISLPMFPELNIKQVERVIAVVLQGVRPLSVA